MKYYYIALRCYSDDVADQCGGTGKNGDFDCGMCNGSGEE
jgi:hypothetical protein